MEVWIGEAAVTAAGVVQNQLVEAGAPLRLRVVLAADEELVGASLRLLGRSPAAVAPSFVAPVLNSDAAVAGSFTNVTWVSADWGGGRSLTSLSLRTANPGPSQVAQIKIARGGSGWYSPPGPHAVDLPANTTVAVGFPDTIADRVMIELLELGVPRACTLAEITIGGVPKGKLPLGFGPAARNPVVRLEGRSPLFQHQGVIAGGAAIEVAALFATLRDQLPSLRGQEFTVEIDAAAAGQLGLRWDLLVDRHLERFAGAGEPEQITLALPWSLPRAHALAPALAADTVAEIHGLRLRAAWTPSSERVELGPVPDPPIHDPAQPSADADRLGVAGLLRPRYQQAQGFVAAPTRPLTGVDLWVRAPRAEQPLALTLEIVEDDGGAPTGASLAAVALSLAVEELPPTLGRSPTWLPIDLPEPLAITAERWWVVVRVDEGELAWLLSTPPAGVTRRGDVTGPRYRLDEGPWIDRDADAPQGWALLRLRSFESTPAPAPTIELLVDDVAHPLRARDDDPTLFELASPSPPAGASVILRARSAVAGSLQLSQLDLRWRAKPVNLTDDTAPIASIPSPVGS